MLAYQGGEDAAFMRIYERTKQRLFSWVSRMVQDEALAEEISQETFLRIYRSKHTYEPTAKFSTWMYTIAARLVFNEARRKQRKPQVTSDSSDIEEMFIPHEVLKPVDHLEKKELREMIQSALKELPDTQRGALMLRYFENMSHEDIASALDTTPKAVKSLLHRGLVRLGQILVDERDRKSVV